MRTIDADELKKMFPDKGEGAWTYNITAEAYIDAQPTVDLWHYPSRGEYPILQGHYLVCVKDKQGDLFVVLAQYVDDVFIVYPYEVVAWMPLPEPPKEEA